MYQSLGLAPWPLQHKKTKGLLLLFGVMHEKPKIDSITDVREWLRVVWACCGAGVLRGQSAAAV